MAKILLINPNKWGRGITHIWIASHSGILKRNNHKVEFFDSSFYQDWSVNEIKFQTDNKMYKKFAEPVCEFTISGTFAEMLKNLKMIGNEIDERTSILTPAFKINKMTVSGI